MKLDPSKLGEPVTRRRLYIGFLRKNLEPNKDLNSLSCFLFWWICFLDTFSLRDVARDSINSNQTLLELAERCLETMQRPYKNQGPIISVHSPQTPFRFKCYITWCQPIIKNKQELLGKAKADASSRRRLCEGRPEEHPAEHLRAHHQGKCA